MKTKINDIAVKLFVFCTIGLPGVLFAQAPTGFIGTSELKFEDNQDWTDALGVYFAGKMGWVALGIGLTMVIVCGTTLVTAMLESKKSKAGDESHTSSFIKVAINITFLIIGVALIALFFKAQSYANV